MMLTGVFRYVRHEFVADRLEQGWRYAGNLGRTHGQWSALMWWCCGDCCVCPVANEIRRGAINTASESVRSARPLQTTGR